MSVSSVETFRTAQSCLEYTAVDVEASAEGAELQLEILDANYALDAPVWPTVIPAPLTSDGSDWLLDLGSEDQPLSDKKRQKARKLAHFRQPVSRQLSRVSRAASSEHSDSSDSVKPYVRLRASAALAANHAVGSSFAKHALPAPLAHHATRTSRLSHSSTGTTSQQSMAYQVAPKALIVSHTQYLCRSRKAFCSPAQQK